MPLIRFYSICFMQNAEWCSIILWNIKRSRHLSNCCTFVSYCHGALNINDGKHQKYFSWIIQIDGGIDRVSMIYFQMVLAKCSGCRVGIWHHIAKHINFKIDRMHKWNKWTSTADSQQQQLKNKIIFRMKTLLCRWLVEHFCIWKHYLPWFYRFAENESYNPVAMNAFPHFIYCFLDCRCSDKHINKFHFTCHAANVSERFSDNSKLLRT